MPTVAFDVRFWRQSRHGLRMTWLKDGVMSAYDPLGPAGLLLLCCTTHLLLC
jgi:hypothetical protein